MASSRSLFETLPMLIVRKVVEYLEERPRASFDTDIDKHNKKKAVLTPLLSASECWRMAALESICDNCRLTFNYASKSFEVEFPAWPASFPYLRLPKSHLIKQVVVPLHLWRTMYGGAFCEALATVQYENLSFPCANTLVLLLSKDSTDGATGAAPVVDQEKVIDFARMLLQLTPAVSAASIKVLNLNAGVPSYAQLYDVLVSELYKGRVTGMEIHPAPGFSSLPFSLQGVSGLTSIGHNLNFSWGPFASLAYRNARTLKTLDIRIAEETNWLDLIYGGTETPAVYDSLTSLLLVTAYTAYGTTWTAIEGGVVPFPSLEILRVAGRYPFDDDLFFRGNGSTLQHLRIPFSALARNILGRFGVLKRSGVTQMDRIDIYEVDKVDEDFMHGKDLRPIGQQVHRILEVATSFSLDNDTEDFPMHNAIYLAPNTAIIKHLRLYSIGCLMIELLNVIAHIPSLVSLGCDLCELGPSIEDIPAEQHLARLRANYHPFNNSFRVFCLLSVTDPSVDLIAQTAIFLAILCPNFVLMDIPLKLRNDFGRTIARATLSDPFKQHADTLRRIVYKMI